MSQPSGDVLGYRARRVFNCLLVAVVLIFSYLTLSKVPTFYPLAVSRMTCKLEPQHCTQIARPVELEYNSSTDSLSNNKSSNRSAAMLQRHKALRERCQQLYGEDHHFLNDVHYHRGHSIFNDQYRLIYCYIPKNACTNLKRIMVLLTGKVKQTDPLKLDGFQVHTSLSSKYLSFMGKVKNETEAMYKLKTYHKVIFVRDPFERLLSAWRNKFGPGKKNTFKSTFGPGIIRTFRNKSSEESVSKGQDVSFDEFIQYVIDLNDKHKYFNEHWAKYTGLCDPCKVGYDFIGHIETLDEDMDYLLQELGVSDFIHFPKRNETYKAAKTADVLTKFYKDVPKHHIKRIKEVYANDSFLFNFDVPTAIQKLLEEV